MGGEVEAARAALREAIEQFLRDEGDRLGRRGAHGGFVTGWLVVAEVARPDGSMTLACYTGDGTDVGQQAAWRTDGMVTYAQRCAEAAWDTDDEDEGEGE